MHSCTIFVNLCSKTFSLTQVWTNEWSHHMSALLPRLLCIVFMLALNILNTIFFIRCILTLLTWKHETICRSQFYPIQPFLDSFKLVIPVKESDFIWVGTTKQKFNLAKAARSIWFWQQKVEFLLILVNSLQSPYAPINAQLYNIREPL